jgi:hypothetical protein
MAAKDGPKIVSASRIRPTVSHFVSVVKSARTAANALCKRLQASNKHQSPTSKNATLNCCGMSVGVGIL